MIGGLHTEILLCAMGATHSEIVSATIAEARSHLGCHQMRSVVNSECMSDSLGKGMMAMPETWPETLEQQADHELYPV